MRASGFWGTLSHVVNAIHVVCAFLLSLTSPAIAQSVFASNAFGQNEIASLARNFIQPLAAQLPADERNIISSIEIKVLRDNAVRFPVAAKLPSGKREIWISSSFLLTLFNYVEALLLEVGYDVPEHTAEAWLSYYISRNPAFYIGATPLSPPEFLGASQSKADSFRNDQAATLSGLSNAALLSILLHEIGHHVEDALYDATSSASEKLRAERIADEWGRDAFSAYAHANPRLGLIDLDNLAGSAIALSLLGSYESAISVNPNGEIVSLSHDPISIRLQSAVYRAACITSGDQLLVGLCQVAEYIIKQNGEGTSTLEDYQARANNGEGFAYFRIGAIEFARGNYTESCENFILHLSRTINGLADSNANNFVAWCFYNKILGQDLSEAARHTLVKNALTAAAADGWLYGLNSLADF